MLGYVSSERLTCLLLELADTNLSNSLKLMKDAIQRKKKTNDDVVKYLKHVAVQITNGMVNVYFRFSYDQKCGIHRPVIALLLGSFFDRDEET